MTDLQSSPLHSVHEALGATFTPFGAWNMPLKYGSELAEHRAVRESAGIFDLSHMGEVRVTGPDAGAFLDYALVSRFSKLPIHKAKYSMMVNASGGIIDDLITYRLGEETFFIVPNAGNATKVIEELRARAEHFDVTITDECTTTALIAVQGPQAEAIVSALVDPEDADTVTQMRYYACAPAVVAGHQVLLARTGYTGEDGFELYIPAAESVDLWKAIEEIGKPFGLTPCGLASRDSLRLEAGMPLYGNELSTEFTPYDAGLGVLVAPKVEDFVGKEALSQAPEPKHKLMGLTSDQRRAARHGDAIFLGEERIGEVTSGQPSPTLGHPIALAYVDSAHAQAGTEVEAEIRGKRYPFTVVDLPFYSRKRNA